MKHYPLKNLEGHPFVDIDGKLWLLDTGAPESFGMVDSLEIDGRTFSLPDHFMGLDTATLCNLVKVECAGLLGANVLSNLDLVINDPEGTVFFSQGHLDLEGQSIPLRMVLGVPLLTCRIGTTEHQLFFDTGAPVCYWQEEALETYPSAGQLDDFFPGFGSFNTPTHLVPLSVGGFSLEARCGRLPPLLGLSLQVAGASGILGNQLLKERQVGYFPRRRLLVLC